MRGKKHAQEETTNSQDAPKPRAGEEISESCRELAEKTGRKKRKRNRGEEELIALAEKYKAVPVRQGLPAKRKRCACFSFGH